MLSVYAGGMNNNLLTELLNFGTLVLGLVVVACTVLWYTRYRTKVREVLTTYYTQLGFLIATVSTLGSLYYSEVLAYAPCVLCWYQRIFMYPISILFIIAAVKRNNVYVRLNSIVLAVIGIVFSGYHYVLQRMDTGAVACGTVGYTSSCSQAFSVSYGYITIPMMALTAFAAIILLGLINKD